MSGPVFPVILSGGSGSRLWPLSREAYPKQLIALVGEHTLLQATAQRLEAIDGINSPIVVCNEEHRFMVSEQLEAIGVTPATILLEPTARNTAPAIAAAALEARMQCDGDDPLLLVTPTDHVIENTKRFARAVREAIREAAAGRIVAFGATPTCPETGYGYIQASTPTGTSKEGRLVERFVEKPNAGNAAALIETGGCYWNCGLFVFGAARYLGELERQAALVLECVREAHRKAITDMGFLRLEKESFTRSPSISVDYAVMEHAPDAAVVPLGTRWSDMGSWAALAELPGHAKKDESGNITQGDVVLQDARNVYAHGETRLVAALGVEDLVIVDTPDALLVANKKATQGTKELVEQLKQAGRDEYRHHRKTYRPWGHYDSIYRGERFQIKHLTVLPGRLLSLQSHRHRAEHWIVVRGTARVTRGKESFLLSEDESIHIPQGTKHRLENPGKNPLELIEIQSGDYLGEDDIIRYEDIYGRSEPTPPATTQKPRPSN